MKPIDLLAFAEHSEKISADHLVPRLKEEKLLLPFLAAHLMDFSVTFAASAVMSSLFNESMKFMINTSGLRRIYSEGLIVGLAGPVLPLVLFSYFFFSYFFNDGQTYGMGLMKIRMKVQTTSFRESFLWASQSALLCFSCGLSYFFSAGLLKNVGVHDYRYQEIFTSEEKAKLDLFAMLEQKKEDEEVTQQMAA